MNNQIGVLQRVPTSSQNQMVAQMASQYINALIEYQTSDDPILNDPTSSQYYFSTAMYLLNFMTMNPDICKRIVANPTLVNDTIEKVLAPDFVDNMKGVERTGTPSIPGATFDDDFGSLLQFLSTILLYKDEMATVHPRLNELVPKLKEWKRTYKNSRTKTISNAAERLIGQIEDTEPGMYRMIRGMQEQSLCCGVASCGVKGLDQLTLCASCRIQRYCGRDHQKADWRYHKHICNKGLQEDTVE